MTSKNLCFKLMKEDLKRRIWAISLFMLAFLFGIVVPIAYIGSTPFDDYFSSKADWVYYVTGKVMDRIGFENGFIPAILIVGAVVCGISGFSYLHSAKKVDLYHSIPVKRIHLFLVQYINGILIAGVTYLLALFIGMVAAATFGAGFGFTFKVALQGYLFHMIYFCLIYTVVVIATILTGNKGIAFLGTLVFFFYGPAVIALVMGYVDGFFMTYNYYGNNVLENIMKYSSPLWNYMYNYNFAYSNSFYKLNLLKIYSILIVIVLLLAVFASWLYRIRPSESSGKAMAFKREMMPIKVLIVIPVSLAFSIFFGSLRETLAWSMAGLLFGAAISHCLIEIIYHFDFRKLFSHKMDFLFCIAASFLIFGGFKYDWFGYDSYLPKEGNIKHASISLNGVDDWVSYGTVERSSPISVDNWNRGKVENEYVFYTWLYEDSRTYRTEHMELSDVDDILFIAETGIELNRQRRKENNNLSYEREWESVTIQYTLKNGKKKSRYYRVYSDMIEEQKERIIDSMDYKTGVFPILTQQAEEVVQINYQQFDKIQPVKLEHGAQDIEKLLTAYKNDWKKLTVETRKQENPFATIQFLTKDMDEAIQYEQQQSKNNRYGYYSYGIEERCYYPIYPSFTETITLLKQAGIPCEQQFDAELIQQIVIFDYTYDYDKYDYDEFTVYESEAYEGSNTIVFQEKENIEALLPALIPRDYWNMNEMMKTDIRWDSSVKVYFITAEDGTTREISCYLDETKIPDFMK